MVTNFAGCHSAFGRPPMSAIFKVICLWKIRAFYKQFPVGPWLCILILHVILFIDSPGANSPIDWVRSCVEVLEPDANSPNRKKILLGLNFYGNDYISGSGGPIVGHQWVLYDKFWTSSEYIMTYSEPPVSTLWPAQSLQWLHYDLNSPLWRLMECIMTHSNTRGEYCTVTYIKHREARSCLNSQ